MGSVTNNCGFRIGLLDFISSSVTTSLNYTHLHSAIAIPADTSFKINHRRDFLTHLHKKDQHSCYSDVTYVTSHI
jgi:hypothetical protein